MIDRPCRSSSFARANTESAPSPLMTESLEASERINPSFLRPTQEPESSECANHPPGAETTRKRRRSQLVPRSGSQCRQTLVEQKRRHPVAAPTDATAQHIATQAFPAQ